MSLLNFYVLIVTTYIPPFATARGSEILKGLNYASGAAGIRNETGRQAGQIISMDMQLQNHQSIVKKIAAFRGNNASSAAEYLGSILLGWAPMITLSTTSSESSIVGRGHTYV
ncbi:hypothetical protein CerSpe_007950 [Prunus speciosa]